MVWLSKENRQGKQFLDFIDIVDKKYDDNIKHIFLILDIAIYTQVEQDKAYNSKVSSKNTSSISTD